MHHNSQIHNPGVFCFKKSQKMIDNLPEELKLQILYKLPIKSLGQCIFVSKSWLSIIKNPSFISTHLNLTISSNNNLLIFRTRSDHFALHFDNDEFDPYKQLDLPFEAQHNPNFRDSGTCNGLICLVEKDHWSSDGKYWCFGDKSIVLWNPSINKTLTLPKPNITHLTHGPHKVFHGLGFDSSTNDHKLVRILSLQNYDEVDETVLEAEIFSLNRNCWTTVTQIVPKHNIVYDGPQAFVNGVLHWIAHGFGRDGNMFCCQIMGFDMGGEVFREIILPEGMEGWIPLDITISVYKESSIGVCFHDFLAHESLEIWVMKEYSNVESWTKIWRLDWRRGELPGTLGFRNNGEVFLEVDRVRNTVIISVDVENQEMKDVGIRDRTFFRRPIDYYVESLVLLDNPNAVSYTIVPNDANILSDASEGSDANDDIDADDASDDEPMDIDDSSDDDANDDASNAFSEWE